MNWFHLALAILACYRLSTTFSQEKGPRKVFQKLRNAPPPRSSWREGLSCPLCLSVWFSAFLCCFYGWLGLVPWEMVPVWWLAVSGGSVLLSLHTGRP